MLSGGGLLAIFHIIPLEFRAQLLDMPAKMQPFPRIADKIICTRFAIRFAVVSFELSERA
jgi:hypothetical protein